MPHYRSSYRDYAEWSLAKKPHEDRGDSRAEGVPDIEELFDAAIRHRFGFLISRAARS
jgi:hypothetical protein